MSTSSIGNLQRGRIIAAAAAAAAAAVFIVDLFTPLGAALPMLYVLPILMTWLVPGRRSTILMAAGSLVLTWLEAFLSPGLLTPVIISNRTMLSALLLVIGWLLIKQKQLAQQAEETQEVLRESEERFRKIYQHAGIGIAITTLDSRFVACNPAYCALTGYSEEELREGTFHSLIHPDDFDTDVGLIQGLMDNIAPSFEIDIRYLHKSGKPVWVHKFVSVLRSDEGTPIQFIRLVTDITERKETEEALRRAYDEIEHRVAARTAEVMETNKRFEWVVKATHDGIYDWDLINNSAYFSPRLKQMHGFNESDVLESDQEWSARIHPDDRQRVMDHLQGYLENRRPEFWEEYRISRKNGTLMWVLDRAVAQRDEQERAVRMVGAETDITWRKEAEERIRRREHEFRTLADNVPAFFGYIDRDQRYRFVNKRYEELFGRSDEEIAGMAMRDLLGSEGYAEVQPHLDMALAGESTSFEYCLTIPDGRDHWFSAQYVPDRDDEGKIQGVFVLLSDITSLKMSEAILRERETQLSDLSTKLLKAQEEERRRVARELHDDITQRLAVLTIELRSIRPSETGPDSVLISRLKKLGESAERLTTDLQSMAHHLHPSILEHAGLEAGVREQVDDFAAQTGLTAEVIARDVPMIIPLDEATCLYRVLQESLQNVQKHANATSVLIRLLGTERGLGLCVHDDGQGFEHSAVTVGRKGLGLTSMLERVGALKGTFRIRTKHGEGTEVHAWVPLPSGEE